MAKWSDKHMYNWKGWIDSVVNTFTKINEWTVTPTSSFGFPVYLLNNTLGALLMGFIIGLMAIPQTLEWIMRNIIDEVEKLEIRSTGMKYRLKEFIYVMLTIFVLIPYTITWGLPKLIMEHRERKRLKRAQELNQHQRVVEEERRRLDDINDTVIRVRREVKEDFKPKMKLKAHSMVEPITLATDNHSIAIGFSNIATGQYYVNFWPSDVTITTHTEGGASTAMVTHGIINNG